MTPVHPELDGCVQSVEVRVTHTHLFPVVCIVLLPQNHTAVFGAAVLKVEVTCHIISHKYCLCGLFILFDLSQLQDSLFHAINIVLRSLLYLFCP